MPHGKFGLEVIALIGQWRFLEHRSVPEMHQADASSSAGAWSEHYRVQCDQFDATLRRVSGLVNGGSACN